MPPSNPSLLINIAVCVATKDLPISYLQLNGETGKCNEEPSYFTISDDGSDGEDVRRGNKRRKMPLEDIVVRNGSGLAESRRMASCQAPPSTMEHMQLVEWHKLVLQYQGLKA